MTKDKRTDQIVFSIIMPCYNSEAYVKNAVKSILMQTYDKWELIIINDGSTDDTLSILNDFAKSDSRIRLFSKENGGYVSAVNYGLDYVSGDYFLFLGSDDWLSIDLLQKISEKIDNEEPDMIGFNTMKHWTSKDEIDTLTSFNSFAVEFSTDITTFEENHPKESAIFFTRDTAKCFSRKLLQETRYYGKYGFDADGIFSMKLANKATSFMAIPIIGYHWTLRNDSLSGRPVTNAVNLDRINNWTDFFQFLLTIGKQNLAAAEELYVSYFIRIMQTLYFNNPTKNQDSNKTIKNGIFMVKRVLRRYNVSVAKGSRVFLISPTAWYFCKRAKQLYRREM